MIRRIWLTVISLLSAASLAAQTPACDPAGPPRTFEREVVLGASLQLTTLVTTYPEAWRTDLLHQWVAAFHAPENWARDFVPLAWHSPADTGGVLAFGPGGQYLARIKRNGHIDRIRVERPSGSRALDSAVVRAFRSIDSAGGFGELPEAILRSRAEWRVVVGVAHGRGATVIPLATSTVQRTAADTGPVLIRRTAPQIATMSASVAGGGFVVEYVVDREGKVDPSTVRVLWSSSKDIAKAAVTAAKGSEYRPGSAGGCAVPVAVVWRTQLGAGPYDPTAGANAPATP